MTATKLSQNPGCNMAHGSHSSTPTAAHSATQGQGHLAPCNRKSTTIASIRQVRCAGTPQPENTAYAVANNRPMPHAAWDAGTQWHKRADVRQPRRTSQVAAQANIVMCKPEMLTK